jgi:hypothetical protein
MLVGRKCRVQGLTARPELNGRVGVVKAWHAAETGIGAQPGSRNRFEVQLEGGEVVRIKLANLMLEPTDSDSTTAHASRRSA